MTNFVPTHRLPDGTLLELEHKFFSRLEGSDMGLFHVRDGAIWLRLDGYYDFECEGGPLRMNVEWDILKRSFEHLCRNIERAHGIVEKE